MVIVTKPLKQRSGMWQFFRIKYFKIVPQIYKKLAFRLKMFNFRKLFKPLPIMYHAWSPVHTTLYLRMRSEFWRHMTVFRANVSQELNTVQLLQIIPCEFVMSSFVSHSQSQEVLTGLLNLTEFKQCGKCATKNKRCMHTLTVTSIEIS